jgi:ribosomal protein S18 acetylase RimI-like enzyme
MQPSDVPGVTDLCAQLGYPSAESRVAERFARLVASDRDAVLIADDGSRVLGWVHVYVSLTLESDRNVEIGGLVVDTKARRRGVGRLLMAGAEAWAAAHDCPRVRLRSNVTRWGAHAFYQSLGYRIVKTQYVFDKDLTSP